MLNILTLLLIAGPVCLVSAGAVRIKVIYDLGPHRFLATFFAVFRSVEGGREGGVWYLVTHTHSKGSQTSV